MLSRESLYMRGCVRGLVEVIEPLPSRAAARLPMVLDPASVGMLLLWSILRWERTFLLICLEELGVDMWGLTRDLDALLNQRKAHDAGGNPHLLARDPASREFWGALDRCTDYWLERAATQAAILGHRYLGTEHLLLEILVGADPALAALLTRHGIEYGKVRDAVLAALAHRLGLREEVVETVFPRLGPRGARWDTPAAGVPHRFGMGILMLMMTMFAVLFAAMQLLGARPEVFIVVAVLFAGVGLGQMLLYGGKYPRAASIWVGAGLFPVEMVGVLIHMGAREEIICLLVGSPLLGAGFGYLAGGLTAGVFLLLEKHAKRLQPGPEKGPKGEAGEAGESPGEPSEAPGGQAGPPLAQPGA